MVYKCHDFAILLFMYQIGKFYFTTTSNKKLRCSTVAISDICSHWWTYMHDVVKHNCPIEPLNALEVSMSSMASVITSFANYQHWSYD